MAAAGCRLRLIAICVVHRLPLDILPAHCLPFPVHPKIPLALKAHVLAADKLAV